MIVEGLNTAKLISGVLPPACMDYQEALQFQKVEWLLLLPLGLLVAFAPTTMLLNSVAFGATFTVELSYLVS